MTDSVNLRAVVLDILMEINEKGEFSHLLINNALTKYQYLDKNKRAFISRLSLGTIENRIELDYNRPVFKDSCKKDETTYKKYM